MAVEDQVVAAPLAGEPGGHVEPLRGQGIFPRLEAVLPQPVVHKLARPTLAARGAVDVAEREREIDYFLSVDQLDHVIRGHISCVLLLVRNDRRTLPVPLPTKLEFVLNCKTSKVRGLVSVTSAARR